MIPLGEWLPDLPDRDNPGATEALNVTPEVFGYSPFRTLSSSTDALSARCRGAGSFKAPDGTVLTFAGTENKLFRSNLTLWTDVSRGASPGTYQSGERWRFALFSNLAVATNFGDAVQKWIVGLSSSFSDLGTNVPKAREVAVIGDFLVLGNVDDALDGRVPNRLHWGPIGSPDGDWTPALSTQADFQDLAEGGAITGIIGGDVGYVLSETAVHRMSYIGSPLVFQIGRIEENRGCVASGSVATDGERTIYLAANGFYLLDHDSGQSVPIGANKVDQWFLNEADATLYTRMSAAMSSEDKLYILSFASGDAGAQPDTILIYNWEVGRWAYARIACDQVGRLLASGFTLEQLDGVADLDSLPASLDSAQWQGGEIIFGAFDTSNRLASFSGAPLNATIETASLQLADPNRALVRGVRPVVDGAATVALGTRDLPAGATIWTAPQATNVKTGMANFHKEARYHKARLNVTGEWTRAQGVDVDAEGAGWL